MPIYACYRGDADNLAMTSPGDGPRFVLKDALGRDWLCVETDLKAMPDVADAVFDLLKVQHAAHRQGLSESGTSKQLFDCPDMKTLARLLVLSTYPPVEESMKRLEEAGWKKAQARFGMGQPTHVTISNGQKTIGAEGDTEAEAWHRVMKTALDPVAKEGATATMFIHGEPALIRIDAHGVARVAQSQVLLDLLVHEYHKGADPESIARDYPSLAPADVFAAIAYYLRNKDEVDAYLRAREEEAGRLREDVLRKQGGQADLKAKLLARRSEQEQDHAAPCN